jgi:hypothetical protein
MGTGYVERVDQLHALGHSPSEEAASADTAASRAKYVQLCFWGEALDRPAWYIRLYNDIA